MKQYKHYSFDLWQTLIKSNPNFKIKRAEYFHSHFNPKKYDIDKVSQIIRDIDIMCDTTNQLIGGNIHAYEMIGMILYKLDYNIAILSVRDIQAIYHILETIFLDNPPVPFDNNTIEVLNKLKSNGATLSILSNTAFIQGGTLRKILDLHFKKDLFLFTAFSDEVGASKPNPHIFTRMIQTIFQLRIHNPILMQDIIHVGDNIIADIKGADNMQIDSFQINSNNKSIIDLL